MSTSDAIQLAAVIIAAIAAIGSAGAALVMWRQWTDSKRPALSVDVAVMIPSGRMFLTVVNYGGPIKKVSFVVVERDQACMSFLPPHGFLAPGERARLQLGMTGNTEERGQVAAVYGFDLAGRYVYAWAANGQTLRWKARRTRWRRRRSSDVTDTEVLHRFYPGAPDPHTLEQTASALLE